MTHVKPTTLAERSTAMLYACGGAGINVGSIFEEFRTKEEGSLALVDTVYFDTSRSNLHAGLPAEKIFTIPDRDGAGKERGHVSDPILKHAKEMLQKHRPGYVNIVLSSASGGSGAVLAAAVINELLAQDQLVIYITIGAADSGVEIKNTLSTIATAESLVQAHGKTIGTAYFENNKETPPTKVDENIQALVTIIALVFSRLNEGLDTRDLYNFLNVERLTSYPAHAVGIESFIGALKQEEHGDTITVASVVNSKDERGIDFVIPYTCYGVLPALASTEFTEDAPIHLVTKAFPFNDLVTRLRGQLDELDRVAAARTEASKVLTGTEKVSGGFLVI